MPHSSTLGLTRRGLLGAGALAGASLAAATSAAHATTQPGFFSGPTSSTSRRDIVIWGSSSAEGHMGAQYPAGYSATTIHSLLPTLLGVKMTTTGIGGDQSWQTLAMRSYDHPYKLDFRYNGQGGVLPSRGGVILNTVDGRYPAWLRPIQGSVLGVPCSIQTVKGRSKKIRIERLQPGQEIAVGTGPSSYWRTGLQHEHTGKTHLLWTGKNNIADYAQVLADTRASFDVEPNSSVVMGHWHAWNDRHGMARRAQVEAVNAAYRAEYGNRYYDAMADLLNRDLWNVPALAPFKIGTSAADKDWLSRGLPPRSIVASDNGHLNALGYTVLAHGLHRFLTGTANLY